jgi:hypothetical protein
MGFNNLEFCLQEGARRILMNPQAVQRNTQKQLLNIASAAFQAGYSPRHFRRIIEEDHIPVIQVGQKNFITASDLETWKSTHGEARLEQCLQQLDRWLINKEDVRRGAQPVQDLGDDD